MSLQKKRLFVDTAYRILKEEGPEGIKIRRLAGELNCTSTVIYRYFEDLDHLVALASVRFLDDYIVDFRNLVNDPQIGSDPYGLNLRMWASLANHAFKNIPIYENLFFGKFQHTLSEVIYEYYQLFMDETKQDFDGYSVSILFNDDIYQRDYVLLRKAVACGTITLAAAERLSQIECHLFHGILLKYKPYYRDENTAQKATAEFMDLLQDLAVKYRKK